ncbi:uncharacterized protein LOC116853782 [Odontomachus brunneus]|uniref:uncharacterized protein LOC116853782 n=1 Tax=Odontomachus brunneus TaxID=486640 RepID=UPI0013F2841E|nr:uncharacterized protein LOC116853782 [Odontomachus brunneus]
MSSDERRQQRKKIRRMKAKKTWSSSSEYSDKDLYLDNDKENRTIQHNNVIVKKRPQNVIQKLTSADVMNITDKSINRTIDIHDKGELFIEECTGHIERQNFCDKNTNKNLVTNDKEHLTENSTRNIERENIFDNGIFK